MTGDGARGGYLERLAARTRAVGTVLCVGIDPDPAALPDGFPAGLAGVERLARLVIEGAARHSAAVKPNLAFFEAFGSAGVAALERIRAAIPAEVPVILDAKRGDIGSTAARQAVALYDALGADAVTLNPYLGADAVAPFVERDDRFAYVLCRTSNPGARELQGLVVAVDDHLGAPEEPLFARVARRAATWGPPGTIGLVVGATAPAELAAVRALAPGLPFLVPGVGAQGGDLDAVQTHGPATAAPGAGYAGGALLVNVSRGIAAAALDDGLAEAGRDGRSADPLDRVDAAARAWAARLPVLP